jgi:hypothetical protein
MKEKFLSPEIGDMYSVGSKNDLLIKKMCIKGKQKKSNKTKTQNFKNWGFFASNFFLEKHYVQDIFTVFNHHKTLDFLHLI